MSIFSKFNYISKMEGIFYGYKKAPRSENVEGPIKCMIHFKFWYTEKIKDKNADIRNELMLVYYVKSNKKCRLWEVTLYHKKNTFCKNFYLFCLEKI